MTLSPFAVCIISITALAGLGLPIGHAMIISSIFYLLLAGLDPATAAIIRPVIPPSIRMVLYALISDASIGYLFLGGFGPGVMLGVGFMVINSLIARRRGYPVEQPIPIREIPRITIRAFPALMLP